MPLSPHLQVVRCNLGSMAFGSLIMMFNPAWTVLTFISDKTNASKDVHSKVLKYALACCKCFLLCFEKSIKFVSPYAYTFVILENRGFCSSCYMSYTLVFEYATQIAINKIVCFVLYLIQSVAVPTICFLCAYQEMAMNEEDIQHGAQLRGVGPPDP